ncbi:MAG: copper amine oxidase N-terminal domain-containing protein, partial [Clostridia bacterium]|nr:copper amine oxidase N-terminal domain-containing protein [Clostridia bacterium]
MKKRVISVLLTLCMAFSYTVFATAEGGDKVEIKFKVGDSVLSINGADVEVETPYIAGDGTTLVPLRVITEAFGAQVDWEGTTKTITLTYPEVGIVLQIGSVVAQVNEHNETLLEAPALSANGVTMVPLRFISETFGADVGY